MGLLPFACHPRRKACPPGRGLVAMVSIAVILAGTRSARAFSSGPPDRRTGAPGESTCNSAGCHSSFALNSGDGLLELLAPSSYRPGETVDIVIRLSHPTASRWGFELTALTDANTQAGELLRNDANTQTSTSGGRQYIKHTSAGTARGQTESQSWSFRWTAPAGDVGRVTLYAAGNAANNNGISSGDFIYTTTASLESSSDPLFVRGDANTDGRITISDAVTIIFLIFRGRPSSCRDAADAGDNGTLELADATILMRYLFAQSGVPPEAPFPECGADTSDDMLDCEVSPPCE